MTDEVAESLRELAGHRGYKLVRSRRRKPGAGDFGKYGLTDGKGAPLLGIGDDGLTASAADIEDYLRAGATQTWQQSAKITPARKAAAKSSPSRAEAPRRAEAPKRAEKQSSPAPPRKTPAKPKPKEAPAEPALSIRSARPADAPVG